MDLRFLGRVYRTSVLVWGFFALWCLAYRPLPDAISFSAGYLISLAGWKGTELGVRALLGRVHRPSSRWVAVAAGFKIVIIAVALWGLLQLPSTNVPALALGLFLIPAVLALKAIGMHLNKSWATAEDNGGTPR